LEPLMHMYFNPAPLLLNSYLIGGFPENHQSETHVPS